MGITKTLHQLKKDLHLYVRHISVYAKYQLVTKGLLLFAILPAFYALSHFLIKSSGQLVLSSGNYKDFLLSFRGLGFLVIALLLFVLTIAIDINAFIAISASIRKDGTPIGVVAALKRGLRSVTTLASPAGAFLLLYTVLLAPLAGFGLKTTLFKNLKIPNFITSVIYGNPLHLTLYLGVLFILAVVGFFLILSFHYMLLGGQRSIAAIKSSIRTVRKNKGAMLRSFVLLNGALLLVTAAAVVLVYLLIERLSQGAVENLFLSRFLMLFTLFTFTEFFNLWFFLLGPLQIHILTGRFYRSEEPDRITPVQAADVRKGSSKSLRRISRFACLLLVFNLLGSALTAFFFDEVFRYRPAIEIVAHRGGGNLAAENTLPGLEAAVSAGAKWSEIDVMRSKDGVYVINHDNDFARLTGTAKRPSEMTWKEIKKLKVKDTFDPKRPSASVPDLDATMDAAKGKIGLLIELKGSDADKKMADDVVAAIKSKDMEQEAVIISLDYHLIEYVESKYPEIKTGYLYFFSLGDTSKIKTDYLIMEESAVNADTIEQIHKEGKKAFVWTVNNPEAIDNLLDANVDGIITDHVVALKASVKRWDKKTDKDIILDELKNLLKGN